MMTSSKDSLIHDAKHLRTTLKELNYLEPFEESSSPLVRHILSDFLEASQHYTDLADEYDNLFNQFIQIKNEKEQLKKTLEKFQEGMESSDDLVMPTDDVNMNDTMMIDIVDKAKTKIENNATEIEHLKAENANLFEQVKKRGGSNGNDWFDNNSAIKNILKASSIIYFFHLL